MQPAVSLRQLLTPAQASALAQPPETLAAQLQATLDWLGAAPEGSARRVITLGDAAYPAALTGRAMAVFTMAMFLGVAAMQWFTGLVASLASARGGDPFVAVMASIAALLVAGAAAFRFLPKPPASEH